MYIYESNCYNLKTSVFLVQNCCNINLNAMKIVFFIYLKKVFYNGSTSLPSHHCHFISTSVVVK